MSVHERDEIFMFWIYLVRNMNFVQFNYRKAMVNIENVETMKDISFASIGMTEWKDDLRKFMLHAGLRNTPTVFLFSDTQVKR